MCVDEMLDARRAYAACVIFFVVVSNWTGMLMLIIVSER